MKEDVILVRVQQCNQQLARVVTIKDARNGMAVAQAMEVYAKRVNASIETKNKASELVLRFERRLGELLLQTPRASGGIPYQTRSTCSKSEQVAKGVLNQSLTDLGVPRKVSMRAQNLAQISPDQFEAALAVSGELNPNKVHQTVHQQLQIAKRSARRLAASGQVKLDEHIVVGDFRQHAHRVPDGSIALIFTDPPYNKATEKVFPQLAEFASCKLAEGGSLIAYCGHLQLPAFFDAFSDKLRYWWTCACVHAGGKTLMREYGIRVGWKPMLWFVKSTRDDTSAILSDVVTGNTEKSHHDWQQAESEAAFFIEGLCPDNGIVCDPFLGSGTTGLVAQRLQRQWIGFELDPLTAQIASHRINS